ILQLAHAAQAFGMVFEQGHGFLAGGIIGGTHAAAEIVRADPLLQAKVRLQRGTWRANADNAFAVGQYGAQLRAHDVLVDRFEDAVVTPYQGLPRAIFAIDIAGTETAAIANEVTVDFAVIAVLNALEYALTRAGTDVAAQRAVRANGRCILQVPFARVV